MLSYALLVERCLRIGHDLQMSWVRAEARAVNTSLPTAEENVPGTGDPDRAELERQQAASTVRRINQLCDDIWDDEKKDTRSAVW